jgi:hypothetical protein
MDDTIVTVRFNDVGEARGALNELKRIDRDGQLRVREAALVGRSGHDVGSVRAAEDEDEYPLPEGGTVGLLVDVLSGPLGTLFARPTEGFRRHGGPSADDDEREAAIEEISRDLEPGVTLVVAEVEEPDPDALASALAAIGGTATERPAEDVYAEVRAAEQAAEAADEEARRVLRAQRREDRRADWERFKETMKSKLP